ncbi:hypothetical protein M3632_16290 [Sphingopyxis alaskensis]|jgi:hypothetical protein|nr:hypothetical protein [Sphingopyxis alaskensis]MCM3420915.1 hypothetical protein [Sphingopyxis alaskensis]
MLAYIVTPTPVHQVRGGQHDGAERRQQSVGGLRVGQRQPAFVRGEASRKKADADDREEGGALCPCRCRPPLMAMAAVGSAIINIAA